MEKKQLGHVSLVKLILTNPQMDIKEMPLKDLTILVGQNGTGKSFLLKTTWFMGASLCGQSMSGMSGNDFKQYVQEMFTNTYGKNNDITGQMAYSYTCGTYLRITIEAGNVSNVECFLAQGVEVKSMPVFLSKDTRLFSCVTQYLKFKKATNAEPSTESGMKTLMDMYPIYDLFQLENVVNRINKMDDKMLKTINKGMSKFDETYADVNAITELIIVDGDVLYSTATVSRKSILTYGAGHQSLLMMQISLA